ncbi:hypothetical protein OKA05_21705 [Luteolibacter arcticus]|uniref:Calx-beta domain-containing protein n=1 Tax=Luteolibacter arcticus TaxID=1581411 RepID=A0ABT3GNT7_9BACT|nr:Calx-beta domain-containing protein [Luteolibacter arcticus]MCW1925191.1 hypothetical protein [Luteolibacter arcticus]
MPPPTPQAPREIRRGLLSRILRLALFLMMPVMVGGVLCAAPANDKFTSAVTLNPTAQGVTITSNNFLGTVEEGEFCPEDMGSPARSVWYRFVSPAGGTRIELNTNGSDFDTKISLYRGTATAGVAGVGAVIGDDDGGEGFCSELVYTIPAGDLSDYFIAIDGKDGDMGNFRLNLNPVGTEEPDSPPENDRLADAFSLSFQDGYAYDSGYHPYATVETGEFANPGLPAPVRSVWYRIPSPPQGASYTVVAGKRYSLADAVISVYRGNASAGVASLTPVTGNDNWQGNVWSRASFAVSGPSGQDYFIAVSTKVATAGWVYLDVFSAPENDNLAAAQTLEQLDLTVEGRNIEATVEAGELSPAGLPAAARTVWYRLPAPATARRFRLTTSGSEFDPVVSAYRGSAVGGVGQLVPVTGDNDSGDGLESRVEFVVTGAGNVDYFIAVGGVGGASGSFNLNLVATPENDHLAAASVVDLKDGYDSFSSNNTLATWQAGESPYSGLGSATRSVWYRIPAAPGGMTIQVDAESDAFDTNLSVYRGSASATVSQLVPVTGDNDSGDGTDSRVSFMVPEGNTLDYYFAVDSADGRSGSLQCEFRRNSPWNNRLAEAILLGPGGAGMEVSGNNYSATKEPGEFVPAVLASKGPNKSVWYRIQAPPGNSYHTVDVRGYWTSDNLILSVYRGTAAGGVATLQPVAGNDDYGSIWNSRVTFSVPASNTLDYFIAVDGYQGMALNFELSLASSPSNDHLRNASRLAGYGSFQVSNALASIEGGESSHASLPSPTASVWYRIPAPAAGTPFTIGCTEDSYAPMVSVFRGPAGAGFAQLVPVAGWHQEEVSFVVPAGPAQDYYLAVDGYMGETGTATMYLAATPHQSTVNGSPAGVFPASSPTPMEMFEGGADAFDLDGCSVLFMPYQVQVGGFPETHYRYTTARMRELPEDLSKVKPLEDYSGNTDALKTLPAGFKIFGEVPAQVDPDEEVAVIRFRSSGGDLLVPEIRVLGGFELNNSISRTRVKTVPGKTTVQFDYGLGRSVESGSGGHDGICQVELFANGWIRLSYLGTTFKGGKVGLFNGYEPDDERDFSASQLVMKDVVVAENAGNAVLQARRPATAGTALELRVTAIGGSAIAGSDFSAPAEVAVIPAGSTTVSVTIPLIADAMAESEEYFTLRVAAVGQPEWVLGEARVWITDATAAQPGGVPRVSLAGNRLKITPPGGSAAGITGFRIVSIEGGTLSVPGSGTVLAPGAIITLPTGAAGLMASSPGMKVKVEAVTGTGTTLGSTTMDLDGNASGPVIGFSRQTVDVKEGEIAQLVVTATQPGATVACEVASVTTGSAAGPADYLFRRQTLQFHEGRASIAIPILADGMKEGTNGIEEFEVLLVNPSSGAVLGPASVAKVRIADATGPMRTPLTQRFVTMTPSGKSLRLALDPEEFGEEHLGKVWRFTGEPAWRASGTNAWNVRKGLHRVQFRAPAGIGVEQFEDSNPEFRQGFDVFMAPPFYVDQGMSSPLYALDVAWQDFFPEMYQWEDGDLPVSPDGFLKVTFSPAAPATGRWRLLGEDDGDWRISGATATLPEGKHLIEFKDGLSGYMAPALRPVEVLGGETASVTTAYRTRPGTAALPTVVADASLKTSTTSIPDFQAIPIQEQRGTFSVSFEFSPQADSSGDLDTLVGLSANKVTNFSQMSAVMRTHSDQNYFEGWEEALGTSPKFTAATPRLTVESGKWYFVEFLVDVAGAKYDLVVTPPDGPAVTVLSSASFRVASAGATPASELRYLVTHSEDGSHRLRNLRVEPWTPTKPSWWTREFPAQTGDFNLALTVNGLFSVEDDVGYFYADLGLSDGKIAPDVELEQIEIKLPLSGDIYLSKVELSLQVDLANHTYTISNLKGDESVSGTLPASFTRADRLHVRASYDDGEPIEAVIDMSLPPHAVAPSGNVSANYVPENWLHIPIDPQGETSRFSFECDVTTNGERVGTGDLIDSIVGLGDARVTIANGWPNVPVTLRAKLSSSGVGVWDAHTGGPGSSTFSAQGSAPVVDGRSYRLKFVVDMTTKRFRATVQPENGPPVVMTEDAPFRKAGVTEIRYLILRNVQGRLAVSNIRGPLPHPDDAPLAFTGQIESDLGFGSGVVVADHAVLTTARLVFDPAKLAFVPKVVWRLPGGGGTAVPDINEPASILLLTGYAPVLLEASAGTPAADEVDLAVLAFRPMTLPDHDNAPGQGGYSGFAVDLGTATWAGPGQTRVLTSFPMAGVAKENHGRLHRRDVSSPTFSTLSTTLRQVASGLEVPPGSEGAPLFVRQADLSYVPAAICVGAASGQPRFRAIDESVASAIYQANEFQRLLSSTQELIKGGVYYIESKLAGTLDANRGHIFSESLPREAKWEVVNGRYSNDPPLVLSGLDTASVPGGEFVVTFRRPPEGFVFNEEIEFDSENADDPDEWRKLESWVGRDDEWYLPEVYVREPAAKYTNWVATYFRDAEQEDPAVTAPNSRSTFLGVENVMAYAFGFDPGEQLTWACDPSGLKPGYPILRRGADGRNYMEFLRRKDDSLRYIVESCENLSGPWPWPWTFEAGWPHVGTSILTGDSSDPWQHVRIPLDELGPGAARGFFRVRVEFDN